MIRCFIYGLRRFSVNTNSLNRTLLVPVSFISCRHGNAQVMRDLEWCKHCQCVVHLRRWQQGAWHRLLAPVWVLRETKLLLHINYLLTQLQRQCWSVAINQKAAKIQLTTHLGFLFLPHESISDISEPQTATTACIQTEWEWAWSQKAPGQRQGGIRRTWPGEGGSSWCYRQSLLQSARGMTLERHKWAN